MPAQFTMRSVTLSDVDTVADHRARMFQDMGEVPAEAFDDLRMKSRDRLQEMIARGEYVGWLTVLTNDPQTVVGGAGIQLREVLPHPLSRGGQWIGVARGRHAIVINVFTEPAWRRQGVAILLIRQIIDWARNEHLDRLVLHASNAGRALYEGLGFVATNEMRFEGD